VLFSFLLTSDRNDGGFARVDSGDFQMADPADDNRGPLLGVIGRRSRPVNLAEDETVEADIVFEVPEGMMPLEVSFGGGFFADTAVYEFR
jgi:hypothetical protein